MPDESPVTGDHAGSATESEQGKTEPIFNARCECGDAEVLVAQGNDEAHGTYAVFRCPVCAHEYVKRTTDPITDPAPRPEPRVVLTPEGETEETS